LLYFLTPLSALKLFWVAAIIVERGKIGQGFRRAIRLLVFNPVALTVGFLWSAINLADSVIADEFAKQMILTLAVARAAITAFAAILAYAYAIAIYQQARVAIFGEPAEEIVSIPAAPGDNYGRPVSCSRGFHSCQSFILSPWC